VKFAIFDIDSGRIDRTISCPLECAAPSCAEDEAFVEVAGETDASHYVAITEAGPQLVAFPEQPSTAHIWDWTAKAWQADLALARSHQWAAVKRARNAAEFGGFQWDGSAFDSDAISQSRIQGATQLAQLAVAQGAPFSIEWTLANNAVRTLSAADLIAVGTALGQHVAAQHAIGRVLRSQIELAQSLQEVLGVMWPESAP
jgi:hypothetical protein